EKFYNTQDDFDKDGKFKNRRYDVFANPREFISTILNDYELLSIAISHGVLDEKMAKTLMFGTLMKDWMTFARFIRLLRDRNSNPRIYVEFEKLYERWKLNPPDAKNTFGKFKKISMLSR
ncbi:MAG: DUF4760 domain-containing protein, partial [bacterium]